MNGFWFNNSAWQGWPRALKLLNRLIPFAGINLIRFKGYDLSRKSVYSFKFSVLSCFHNLKLNS